MADMGKLVAMLTLCLVGAVVLEGYTLTVTVRYPKDKLLKDTAELYLRGDMAELTWGEGRVLDYLGDDTWQTQLNYSAVLASELLSMKVLVNDRNWQIGANEMVTLPKADANVTLFPWFNTYTGEYVVTEEILPPPGIELLPRKLVIYTPASYYENPYRVIQDVLIMHDGQNLFNDRTSFLGVAWHCQDTVDENVVTGAMREILIVGIYNTIDRTYEYTYSVDENYGGGGGDIYLDFIEQAVLPYVMDNYRVDLNQPNLGILGSSLGGLISCYAGWTRSSQYSRAGCMSSSFWWNNEDFDNVILVENPPPNTSTYEVYLDSGNKGFGSHDGMDETITVRDHIDDLGFTLGENEFYYLDDGGSHNEESWGSRFYVPMQMLYPPIPHRDVVIV
mmetsp:Transcript_3227/g.8726  ORF Transcript_3227/g.8726 Transcript_3227/m.8726 type:complete len:391 (+) Transcript_3227:95-1267(+)